MRAAVSYVQPGLGTAIILGRDDIIKENARNAASTSTNPTSRSSMRACRAATPVYADYLYERMQEGPPVPLIADASSTTTITTSPPAGGAGRCRLASSPASPATVDGAGGMCAGSSKGAKPMHLRHQRLDRCCQRGRTIDRRRHRRALKRTRCATRYIPTLPSGQFRAAHGLWAPHVAMLAYSTFGHPRGRRSERIREAVKLLDKPRRFRV